MGTFGFFIFLSVAVIAGNWRAVSVSQHRRDVVMQLLENGQQVEPGQLELLLGPSPRRIAGAQWKIGVLLVLGVGAIVLSLLSWEMGAMPVLIAGIVGLLVAYATWAHERRLAQLEAAPPIRGNAG
jgi:fatty acid desaturase